jgi:hypothetical protein
VAPPVSLPSAAPAPPAEESNPLLASTDIALAPVVAFLEPHEALLTLAPTCKALCRALPKVQGNGHHHHNGYWKTMRICPLGSRWWGRRAPFDWLV